VLPSKVSSLIKTLASGRFWGFSHPKQLDRTWLCACVTQVMKVVECCSKAQKTWQVF